MRTLRYERYKPGPDADLFCLGLDCLYYPNPDNTNNRMPNLRGPRPKIGHTNAPQEYPLSCFISLHATLVVVKHFLHLIK